MSPIHSQAECDALQREFAGFDFGEVQDVVQQRHQGLAGFVNHAEIFALRQRERRVQQQFGHADDGVHRRADFVTHVRQERTLGPVGRFRGLLRQFAFGLCALPLDDLSFQSRVGERQFVGPLLNPQFERGVRRGELLRHVIEGARQRAEFVAGLDGHAGLQISRREFGGRLCQAENRFRETPGQQIRGTRADDQHHARHYERQQSQSCHRRIGFRDVDLRHETPVAVSHGPIGGQHGDAPIVADGLETRLTLNGTNNRR